MTVTANGMTVPSLETSNVLQHLEGPEYVLQVGEGPSADPINSTSTIWLSREQARMSFAMIFSLRPRHLILPRLQS
jgi:hypothetical protein